MKILDVRDVSCVYGAGTPFETVALDHVSVGFEKGRITGVIGHTGSGKSTLVQMLNGLLRPTSGEVLLDGQNIWDKPKQIGRVRFRVGLVMQYPEYQLFDETVRADIGYGPRNMGLSADEIEERVLEAAEFVGISPDLLGKSPLEISGGQKRRVALAGVIAMRPEILVLDEPAAGLDPRGKTEIFERLCAYREARNATLIFVSHSMEDMAKYAEDIVMMQDARLLACGTVREIFERPALLRQTGLDVPAVFRLAERLREMGYDLTGDLYTVEGLAAAIRRRVEGGRHA